LEIKILTPNNWPNYELIDSGGYEKLERFGDYITARPEPQAVWNKALSEQTWEKTAHAYFKRAANTDRHADRGTWQTKKGVPDRWTMPYQHNGLDLEFKVALSSFKHVGVFPEQAVNWDFIADKTRALPNGKKRVLNLFAYTGIASLAARQAGAEVTHVEAIKQTVSWARDNMERSRLADIRWVVEDALKYVQREVRRGSVYQGIILDPPAYGRGPNGEKWVLEDHLNELMHLCGTLLDPTHHFLVLNLYSMGFSPLIAANLAAESCPKSAAAQNGESAELYVADRAGRKLPLGVSHRFSSV
jgi:23S rRNA (cytosine1962-C5)-methyltransferase